LIVIGSLRDKNCLLPVITFTVYRSISCPLNVNKNLYSARMNRATKICENNACTDIIQMNLHLMLINVRSRSVVSIMCSDCVAFVLYQALIRDPKALKLVCLFSDPVRLNAATKHLFKGASRSSRC